MKRVLVFSLAYYPSFVSGAEAAVKEITDRISTDDIEFHLITLRFDPQASRRERIGQVNVHRVGWGGARLSKMLFIPLAALKARVLHAELRFDAVWALMTYMLLPTMLAKALGVRVPHVLTLQDGDPYEKVFHRPLVRLFAPALDRGFRTASRIQAISSYLAAWPAKRGYRGMVELIRNGANPRDLHDAVSEKEILAVHERWKKQSGDVWLVNTARLVHQKANDVTIRALPSLPPRVKLLLVGSGEDEGTLRALAKNLSVEDRVMFAGQVSREEVTAYRRAADIFVGPSRSEGLGNAFLSAMASRLPVVTTREGGLAEFAFGQDDPEHAQTAWVVRKDSPEEIVAAVETILANPAQAARVAVAAREMVQEEYDWDRVAREMRARVFAPVLG